MNSKGAIGEPWGHNFLKITLDIPKVADDEQQKNVIGVFSGSLKTYTRYSRVADEEQKEVLGVLSNLVEGGHEFLKFL